MGLKQFDCYTWVVAFLAIFCLLLVQDVVSFFVGFEGVSLVNSFFYFDGVSFYLSLLSIGIWFILLFYINCLTSLTVAMVSFSVFFSILCYCCGHALLFWFFYEMSILCLLFLLVMESPYSERYIASWYLLGYVVVTSLPMLACIFYISFNFGTFSIFAWHQGEGVPEGLFVFLAFLFVTKIPLFPFHVWLPIVHAEASSIVSVCLSGFVMKLGILGVFRLCYSVAPEYVFFVSYVLFLLAFTVSFFFSACRELDGKRWLAFLSLSHITIPIVCLCVGLFDNVFISFLYCLGHGFSAGVTFLLLWAMYDVTGTRNWFLVKNCVSNSLLLRFCCVFSLCTVASFPPTVQFFSEISIFYSSGFVSFFFFFLFLVYLFFGGLVPIFVLGVLLCRHYSIGFGLGSIFSGLCSVIFLVFWSFILFMLV
uniref:NADH dehydrogenase subunit 4 n=1 Tax=Plagiorchis multiglandularis TaxID=3026102 RepID=UPI0023D80C56|nr:NADH dehydrogenase subunit 4 [Plagiorchis multiglandularis]WCQ78405.1 NADH dehydrogenase subunit 4 [Plagiorchis multiglandularis]